MRPSGDVNPDFDNFEHFLYDLLTRLAETQDYIWSFMRDQSVEPPRKRTRSGMTRLPASAFGDHVPIDPEQSMPCAVLRRNSTRRLSPSVGWTVLSGTVGCLAIRAISLTSRWNDAKKESRSVLLSELLLVGGG
jgi:hypothetical protein